MSTKHAGTVLLVLLSLTFVACADDEGTSLADAGVDVGADAPGVSGDATADVSVPAEYCEGATSQLYDPMISNQIDTWPDQLWTRVDEDSPTGERLFVDEAPWVPEIPTILTKTMTSDLNAISGFGTHGAVFFRFDGELGEVPEMDEAANDDRIILLDLDADPVTRIPFETRVLVDEPTLIIQPLLPLAPGHRHAAIVTTALTDVDGGCIAPSRITQRILDDNIPGRMAELTAPWIEAVDAAGLERSQVSAITTFRVHREHDVFAEIAEDIDAMELQWGAERSCETTDRWVQCELSFEASDFRSEDGAVRNSDVGATYALPVRAWMPLDADDSAPLAVFGHGLNGDVGQGGGVASRLVAEGYVVVATDALEHGNHPSYGDPSVELDALRFLGVTFDGVSFDAGALQGNFMQTVLDRLQLISLVQAQPDIDGDGAADVDASRVSYWGISLGGMLGSGTMALSPDIDAGVLSIAGGHLVVFVTDTANAAPFVPIFAQLAGGEDAFQRWLIVAQAAIDSADPATWGAHIVNDRLVDGAPDVLLPVSIHDDTVPPRTGRALARAIHAPHLEPVFAHVSQLAIVEGPVAENFGGITGGFSQYDLVTSGGELVPSTHDNLPYSVEAEAQALHFFRTWRDTGTAEIIVTTE